MRMYELDENEFSYDVKLQAQGILRNMFFDKYKIYITSDAIAYLFSVSESVTVFEQNEDNKIFIKIEKNSGAYEFKNTIKNIITTIITTKILKDIENTKIVISAEDLKQYESEIKKAIEKYKRALVNDEINDEYEKLKKSLYLTKTKNEFYYKKEEIIKKELTLEEALRELQKAYNELKEKEVLYIIEENKKLEQKIRELEQKIRELEKR